MDHPKKICGASVLGAYLLSRAVKENQAMRLSRLTSRLLKMSQVFPPVTGMVYLMVYEMRLYG